MKVYFVGAGPGDPELITVKGLRLLQEAAVVVYAGSLINPELLRWARPEAKLYDSASLTLEETVELMAAAVRRGQTVVRLHSGDPSLFGAIQEQMDRLAAQDIPYEVVPGVSSVAAAAAAVQRELTVPGVSQTVILTRLAGRTPVPARQDLAELARHRATLALFLSSHLLEEATARLAAGYDPQTPAALVYKASWPEQRVWRGELGAAAAYAKEAGIDRTALLLVGDFLAASGTRSRLYDGSFAHGWRGKRGGNSSGGSNQDGHGPGAAP